MKLNQIFYNRNHKVINKFNNLSNNSKNLLILEKLIMIFIIANKIKNPIINKPLHNSNSNNNNKFYLNQKLKFLI